MEDEEKEFDEVPFPDFLDALFGEGEVPLAQLMRLSDMQPGDFDTYVTRWMIASAERRAIVARHLADLSEENFAVEFAPVFRVCLDDSTDAVKLAALDGLWDSTNTTVIGRIIELMGEKNSADVRTSAAKTLAHYVLLGEWGQIPARFRDRAADALVIQHNNLDNPISLRRATLESLGASSNESVPEMIAEAYESDDRGMQVSALFAMGNSADTRWLGTIIAEMESPWTEMRAEAARAAGELGSSDLIGPLANVAYDPEESVQSAAITSLGQIGSDRAKEILSDMMADEEMEHQRANIKKARAGEAMLDEVDFDGLIDEDEEAWDDEDDYENEDYGFGTDEDDDDEASGYFDDYDF